MSAYVVEPSVIIEEGAKPENRFEFQLTPKGKKYTVPKLGYLPRKSGKFIRQNMRELGEADILRGLIERECPEAFSAVDDMEDDQCIRLSQAWAEASGITAGESEASNAE